MLVGAAIAPQLSRYAPGSPGWTWAERLDRHWCARQLLSNSNTEHRVQRFGAPPLGLSRQPLALLMCRALGGPGFRRAPSRPFLAFNASVSSAYRPSRSFSATLLVLPSFIPLCHIGGLGWRHVRVTCAAMWLHPHSWIAPMAEALGAVLRPTASPGAYRDALCACMPICSLWTSALRQGSGKCPGAAGPFAKGCSRCEVRAASH